MGKTLVLLTCAWVLWSETTTIDGPISAPTHSSHQWGVIATATTQSECEAKIEQGMKFFDSLPGRHHKQGGVLTVTREDGLRVFMVRNLCLPDTVDPRDPKR